MTKYTQRQLKEMVNDEIAQDITHIHTTEQSRELTEKEGYFRQVGYASGVYGCNGMLLKGYNTGTLYAITSRTQAIYLF